MKYSRFFLILLVLSSIVSCDEETTESIPDISRVTLRTGSVDFNSVKIIVEGGFSGGEFRMLYRKKNTTGEFISVTSSDLSEYTITNLERAAAYEVKLQASSANGNNIVETVSYFFTTRAVRYDYDRFNQANGGSLSSARSIFSHLGKDHVIHAEGLSDFDQVQVFLVNEERTDSLEISNQIVADSLTFKIPDNYLSQSPRESLKKSFVGIKIKDSYEYLLNVSGWVNYAVDPDFDPVNVDDFLLKLRISNNIPFIEKVTITQNNDFRCPNNAGLAFQGDFFGFWNFHYWTPTRCDLVLFDADDNLYDAYTYIYDEQGSSCGSDSFRVNFPSRQTAENGIWLYHARKSAYIKIPNFPTGTYKAKMVFYFAEGADFIESNVLEFEY